MPVLRSTLSALALVLSLVCCARADAQSRFALELSGGSVTPLSATARNAVRLVDERTDPETGLVTGLPYLSDRWNAVGWQFNLAFLLASAELRYSYERLPWGRALRTCDGDRRAIAIENGEIDDAEVRYICTDRPERLDIARGEEPPVSLHALSAGIRIPIESLRFAEFWAVAAPGIAVTRYSDNDISRRLRLGALATAGAGADVNLDPLVTLTFDIRYQLLLLGNSTSAGGGAGRAVASGRTVLRAIVEPFHSITAAIGVRFNFR